MKRTRAQQPKAPEPQDPATEDGAGNNPTKPPPQRRAKQPRQPKGAKKPGPAATRGEGAAAAVAGNAAAPAAAVASPAPETAPTVPDVSCRGAAGEAGSQHAVDCWDTLDAGLGGGAWWTWGVDEEKLLGWFPFVEEDFRCLAGRAADAELAFDDDIWRIHQIYEIPSHAAAK